ncbi:MAG: TIGR04024 family LLM class F420-dependent oxidoreductase [Halobacteriaceae archaeon]
MTARDLHLPVAAQPSLEALLAVGTRAERLGYDRVWAPETWGRDAVTILTALAERTEAIGLGTSILPVYSRSPALAGQTAATLQEASEGRLRLGVGPSGPAVIENWHGRAFDRPLKQTREFVEIVRLVTAGETADYDGDVFELSGFRLRFDPPERPPVDVAGMGPKAVELAGRFADGWHALLVTPEGLRDRLDDLRRGASLGDRDPEAVRVTLIMPCIALEDAARARRLARQHIAFYIGGMGTFYRDALARQGYEAMARTVHEAWTDGDRERAIGALDEALVTALTASGTPEQARERLARASEQTGVDAVAVSLPRGASPEEITETVGALAPDRGGF